MKPFPNRWIRTVRFRWFAAVAVSVSSAHGIYAAEPDEPTHRYRRRGRIVLSGSDIPTTEARRGPRIEFLGWPRLSETRMRASDSVVYFGRIADRAVDPIRRD